MIEFDLDLVTYDIFLMLFTNLADENIDLVS